jgi:PPP family 3-phenylpropionic acid transporter
VTTAQIAAQIVASPSSRMTLVMSLLFCAFGVAMPFLPRWLEETRGLSGLEIALVLSVAQMTRIIIGPLLATWADGFSDRGAPIKWLAIATLFFHAMFFLADGFVQLMVLAFAAGVTAQAIVPLVEGGTLRASLRPGGLPYGPCRAVGSGVFILGTVAGGLIVGAAGVITTPAMLLTAFALMTAAAWLGLMPDPAPPKAAEMGFIGRLRLGLSLLRNPRFAMALGASGMIQASHAFFYNFTAIVWRDQGVADGLIGVLIATGVLAEITLLAFLPRVERRFEPDLLIAIGAIAAIIRWTAFAFEPSLAWLWPLQTLHALSFAATHVGALRMIQRESPEEVSGIAQTLYAALAAGLFMGLSALMSGALHDAVGPLGYLAMAGLAVVGLAMITPALVGRR